MITARAHNEVTTNAVQQGVFTIRSNGKAFKILIDKLYANKPQSITREIWSNALDGQVEGGCAVRPFEVTFPSVFDPTFRVRDFGISLSHSAVMGLYTTVFESTKEDTDDQVGKFGLGSKSPFAYTDTFAVTAVLDGEKRHYAAVIGADGVPTINYMGSEETEEENGVEVAFPVEKQDIGAFAEAAKRVSMGFDVKPIVTGNDAHVWPKMDPLLVGTGWKLLKDAMPGYRPTAYGRMGCVLYPLNVDALDGVSDLQRLALGASLVIDFKMGELEPTASREELSYGRNEPTASSILRRVNEVLGELKQIGQARYDACPSFFEACVMYNSDLKTRLELFKDVVTKGATWRGVPLVAHIQRPNTHTHGMDIVTMSGKDLKRKTQRFKAESNATIEAIAHTHVIIEDMTGPKIKRVPARVVQFIKDNSPKQVVWVRVHSLRQAQHELLAFLDKMDGVTSVNSVEELALPPSLYSYSGGRRPVMARRLESDGFTNHVNLDADDFADGGFYVPLDRMEPTVPAGCRSPQDMQKALIEAGALDRYTQVYGAPKALRKKFEGDQWVNLYDFAREWVAEQTVDIAETTARKRAVDTILYDDTMTFLMKYVDYSRCATYSPAQDAAALYAEARSTEVADTSALVKVHQALGMYLNGTAKPDPFIGAYTGVMESLTRSYPLLPLLMGSGKVRYTDSSLDIITDYVIMCDTLAEQQNHSVRLTA